MRKLASIQLIRSLEAIDGADAIEKATVLGWQLVVKKGEFQVGDLCVYCEIDSLMPERPEFGFLKPTVPIIKTDYELDDNIDTIVHMATIRSVLRPDAWAEGIVIRPLTEKIDMLLSKENFNNGRVTFKAINPEFLLKYGE